MNRLNGVDPNQVLKGVNLENRQKISIPAD